MGLLPCLRRGSDRWWLPRSSEVTEVLGQVLLGSGRSGSSARIASGSAQPAWQPLRARLLRVLRLDPPLMIYTALSWPGDRAELSELADWLIEHAIGRLASGDAFLGVPSVDGGTHHRWNKLRDHYKTLPLQRWLDDAHLWLEVAGPRVPTTWREQWPTIVDGNGDDATAAAHSSSDCMLQQLARMVQRQKSLEQSFDDRLRKSKLGALKQLAYGLSHEINNPLANISTRAQQLQRGEQDATRIAILERIIEQVYRAHEMIADLMFYANPPEAQRAPCDLCRVLEQIVGDFRGEAERQAIRLELKTPGGPVEAVIDNQMIGEALRALVRNAIDAVGCEGTIVVSLTREPDRVVIHVADSGPGLSAQAREHAFDAYFSGREAGRGLGLGLCRAYRIAKLHDGDVTLAGGPIGCVATITLPSSL